jgi:hypothetical protein
VLLKESPNLFGGWDERFCILKGQRFVYKEDCHPTSPNAGVLNFNLLSCQLAPHRNGNACDYFTYWPFQVEFPQSTLTKHSYSRRNQWRKPLNGPDDWVKPSGTLRDSAKTSLILPITPDSGE